jgi:arylsulfate sulfotransferase
VNTTGDDYLHPFKLLSNGHLLLELAPDSSNALNGLGAPAGTSFDVREVDYTNTIFRDLTMATIQANLNASGYVNAEGQQVVLSDIHHDVTVNPTTGHWLIISNVFKYFSSLAGYPKGVNVLGDVLIDVDPDNNFAVDWVWNEFDHLDISRQPMGFPDWTHTNAIVYSADDHNILVSLRHQNWVLKLNYNDAAGDGTILWHLGYQGDFTLIGGAGTQDWQYAQHEPSFTTPNTTGVFGLVLMDNGNDRTFPTGFTCPVALTNGQCLYSRAPVFTIDESAMTATLGHGTITAPYNSYGGNAELLANGDIEADYCGVVNGAVIQETTPGNSPQVVLSIEMPSLVLYRGHRLPSPYPGVTWSAAAEQFQARHATHPASQ